MKTIEDRIAAAARAAADTVTPYDVPPLRMPARRARRSWSWSSGSAWTRRLTPAAAAVAVIVVVIAAVGLSRAADHPAPVSSPAATGTIASLVASGQVPRYFVAFSPGGDAVVRATATGHTLATIRPSGPGSTMQAVSAAADDRTFVLEEQQHAKPIGQRNFYVFRLNAAGRPSALRKFLALPNKQATSVIALSPDGSELAIAVDQDFELRGIKLYDLTGAFIRSWTTASNLNSDPGPLCWTRDGSTLMFNWADWVRLLDVHASSDNLLTASRAVAVAQNLYLPHSPVLTSILYGPVLTSDGKTLVFGAQKNPSLVPSDRPPGSWFAEYSAATGQLVRILGKRSSGYEAPFPLWTNYSGSVLIGAIQASRESARLSIGVITRNGYAFVPWSPPVSATLNVAW